MYFKKFLKSGSSVLFGKQIIPNNTASLANKKLFITYYIFACVVYLINVLILDIP